MCGEQFDVSGAFDTLMGSSPRVRGTGDSAENDFELSGIIPACAGNRHRGDLQDRYQGDHPRVCGEQFVSLLAKVRVKGSSPRVRGTDAHH